MQRNNGWTFSKFNERYKPTDSEEWSSNSINPKKVTSKQIIIKFLKTKYEENIMKETQENNILHVVEKIIRML